MEPNSLPATRRSWLHSSPSHPATFPKTNSPHGFATTSQPAEAHLFMDAKAHHAHCRFMKMLAALLLIASPTLAYADTITLTPERAEAAKEAGAARNAEDA